MRERGHNRFTEGDWVGMLQRGTLPLPESGVRGEEGSCLRCLLLWLILFPLLLLTGRFWGTPGVWGTAPGPCVLGNGTLCYAWLPRSLHQPVQLPQLDPEDNAKQLITPSCLCAFTVSSIRYLSPPQDTRVLLSPSSH